jgi:hypothetical protein
MDVGREDPTHMVDGGEAGAGVGERRPLLLRRRVGEA